MAIKVNTYQTYYNVKKRLLDKQNSTLKSAAQNKINYYKEITSSYLKVMRQHVTEKSYSVKSENIFTIEESNYTSRLFEDVSETIPIYETLIKDLENPFKLFVMGPGNYGKSTLINSLLGTGIKHAPENIKPLTWKIDIFEASDKPDEVKIIYSSGHQKKMTKSQAEKVIEEEEDKITASKKAVNNRLKTITKETKMTPVEIKELKLKLEREKVYKSDLVEVHWGIKKTPLLSQFSIVDTPGLDQVNFSGDVRKNAIDYYHKSDGVIWLLDATSINAKNSEKMLRELEETLEKMGGSKASNNMIAVLNRMDLVSQDPEQEEQVIKMANELFKGKFKKIIPYSALQAFSAMEKTDQKLEKESGRISLMNAIKETFYLDANRIQADKKDEACRIYTNANVTTIKKYQDQFNNDHSLLNRGLVDSDEQLITVRNRLVSEYLTIIERHFQNLHHEIESHLDHASSIADEGKRRRYLLDEVYKIDYLNKVTTDYSEKIKKTYHMTMKDLIQKYHFTQYNSLNKYKEFDVQVTEIPPLVISNLPNVWMPSAGWGAAIAGGIGMLFGPIGAAIGAGAGYLMSSEVRKSNIEDVRKSSQELSIQFFDSFNDYAVKYHEICKQKTIDEIYNSFIRVYNIKTKDYKKMDNVAIKINYTSVNALENYQKIDVRFLPLIENLIFIPNQFDE